MNKLKLILLNQEIVNNHNKVDKEKLDDLIRKKEIFPTFYTRELTF